MSSEKKEKIAEETGKHDEGVDEAQETKPQPADDRPPVPVAAPNTTPAPTEGGAGTTNGATQTPPANPTPQATPAPAPEAQITPPVSIPVAPIDQAAKPAKPEDSHPAPAPVNPPAPAPRREEVLSELTLQQVLKINMGLIDFGELLPGQILEENLIIMNTLASTKVPFKIKVNCLTKEFDDLDEYVYSMRRPNNNDTYNYNDTFLILLTAKSVSYYKVAIKVPNVKEEKEIMGSIDLMSQECPGNITIPIRARVIVPALKCEKMITLKSLGLPVVKLYMKTPKRQDFRINLKNMCKLNLMAELFILKNDDEVKNMDFNFFPQSVSLPPNMPINFMMSAKCISNEADILNKEIHCVLIVKIKNSSAIFSYPIVILIGDGKPEGKTMS